MLFINYHGQDSVHPDIGKNINEIEDKEEITYQKNLEIEPTDGRGLISFNKCYLQYGSSKFLSNSLLGVAIGFILIFSTLIISILLFFMVDNYYKNNSQDLQSDVIFLLFFLFSILSVVFFYILRTKNKLKVIFVMQLYLIGRNRRFISSCLIKMRLKFDIKI